ncbi:MAG: hypothetical protein J2P47_12140 [Acetobacteraceae bacterium]|nr:hypothetical protein [Acetobacteraceae bacterium]
MSSEAHQVEQVKLTVALAEREAGGKVVQASLLLRGCNASYTVVALPNVGEVWRGSVDANSGALIDERVTALKDAGTIEQVDPAKAKLAEKGEAALTPGRGASRGQVWRAGIIRCQPGGQRSSSLSNAGGAWR